MNKKVLHIVLNDFEPDNRVLKEATSLEKEGYNVTIFSLWSLRFLRNEKIGNITVRRIFLFSRSVSKRKIFLPLKFLECVLRMLWQGLQLKPDIVHSHDLNALVVGYLIGIFTKCILVYDSHELWSDSNYKEEYPRLIVRIILLAEKIMVKRVDKVITVSSMIAKKMEENLDIESPIVIRNVPHLKVTGNGTDIRSELRIPHDGIIFLYIGGILPNRGIDLLIKSFIRLNRQDTYLVFLGNTELPAWLMKLISPEIPNRIICYPPVHPDKVVALSAGADVGIHPIQGTNQNHLFCLPNKIFEYIQAGLAVIVTDLPEMGALVNSKGIGLVFKDGSEEDLLLAMKEMVDDRSRLFQFKNASESAAKELCWENERLILLKIYLDLFK